MDEAKEKKEKRKERWQLPKSTLPPGGKTETR